MFRNSLALALIICCPTLAFAWGYAAYEEVLYVRPATDLAYDIDQYEAENHTVFDLLVVVDNGDEWTTAYCYAYTWCVADPNQHCATFWDHPEGGNTQEGGNPGYFGLAIYDSFWTCTEEYPNPDIDPIRNATTFDPGSPLQNGPYVREAYWRVDPESPNVDGGTYALARHNLIIDCSSCECPGGQCYDYEPFPGAPVYAYLTIEGEYYFASSGGAPYVYQVDIPICWYVPECPADVDGDNDTDLADLADLLQAYASTTGDPDYNPAADFDDDGHVNIRDLAFLLGDYGCGT